MGEVSSTAVVGAGWPGVTPWPARPPRAVTAVGALLVIGLAFNVAHALGVGGHNLDPIANDWVYNALLVGASGLCLARGAERAWLGLGVGIALWSTGDILYSLLYGEGVAPVPSVCDPLYLSFYPCAFFAIAALAADRRHSFELDLWLDGAVVASAVAAVAAATLVGPVVEATGGGLPTVATNLAYPLADVLLLAMVVWTFALARWQPARVLLLLGAGLVSAAIADSLYLYRTATGTYHVGTLLDTLWPSAMLLLASAAWSPDVTLPTPTRRSWRPPLVVALAAAASLAVLAYGAVAHIGWLALVLAIASLALVIVRAARAAHAHAAVETVRRLQHLTDAALAHASLDELLEDLLARIRDGVRVDSAAVVLHEPDAPASSAAQPASAQELGMALEVPLLVGRERIGALRVGRERYLPFSNEERALLGLVADRTAVAIARAQLYEREHGIAETLQRTLLPDKLPDVPGVDLAARYLPGGAGMVGGDWYDVVPLPDGGLALLMGDVAGRGVGAAALMGQLRIAARAYAFEDPSPGYVLERLNRLVGTMGEECMATAVYGVLHRGAQKLRLAAAAHPPPVVIMPDGGATALEDLRGLPLGALPDTPFAETHVDFEPGSSVLFYTDGLIERRGEPLRVGLDRLLHAIPAGSDAPAICDRIIEGLLPAGPTADDAALLVVQTRRRAAR